MLSVIFVFFAYFTTFFYYSLTRLKEGIKQCNLCSSKHDSLQMPTQIQLSGDLDFVTHLLGETRLVRLSGWMAASYQAVNWTVVLWHTRYIYLVHI